jgi:hypothetical protein
LSGEGGSIKGIEGLLTSDEFTGDGSLTSALGHEGPRVGGHKGTVGGISWGTPLSTDGLRV